MSKIKREKNFINKIIILKVLKTHFNKKKKSLRSNIGIVNIRKIKAIKNYKKNNINRKEN